ncbi:hypothetical protein C0Q70_03167 [Pomacea canaliculata]|uniref:Sushi domain-containing protein n=1 Tax=Pomacea canaliculata TaxID=400727 RepID=A0A2T7PRY9_POMCA|nr:hypothetical protein C0Q70_03167 [Pomacea canaliculata]
MQADYSEGDSLADAVLTVAQTGGSFGECGNVTTSSIERLYLLKCDTRQGRKPWGHSIKVTARFLDGNPGRLELRDVSVQGRVHAGELALSGWGRVGFPLNIPRLEMTSALQSDYVSGDTVEYACISGLHELRGSGVSECSPFGSWTTPTLVCTVFLALRREFCEVGAGGDEGADQGGWMAPGDLALVTDPHTDTCYSETSQHDVIVYRVHLPQEVEVHTVTAVTTGPLTSMEVSIVSSAVQRLKTCGSERVTSSFTSVTCEQMFPGDVVEVTMTRVNSSLAFDICDVGVYGRLTAVQENRERSRVQRNSEHHCDRRECVVWVDTLTLLPTLHLDLPDMTVEDAGNFCRNPGGMHTGPVCYVWTRDGGLQLEDCDVTLCGTSCRLRDDGQITLEISTSLPTAAHACSGIFRHFPSGAVRTSTGPAAPAEEERISLPVGILQARSQGSGATSTRRPWTMGIAVCLFVKSVEFVRVSLMTSHIQTSPSTDSPVLVISTLMTSLQGSIDVTMTSSFDDVTESSKETRTLPAESQPSSPAISSPNTKRQPSSSTSTAMKCACACTAAREADAKQRQEQLTSALELIHSSLSVDVNNLSSRVRRKTSAKDDRVSSIATGMTGVAVLVVVAVLLLTSDILSFLAYLQRLFAHRGRVSHK